MLFNLIVMLLAMLPSGAGQEAQLDPLVDLSVGHWVEVRGTSGRDGTFQAQKIQILQPGDKNVIIAMVQSQGLSADGFMLLGQPVSLTERTSFNNIDRRGLEGARIKIEGYWRGPRKFSARSVSARGPGRERLVGRIDDLRLMEGGVRFTLMRYSVFATPGVELSSDGPLGEIALAPLGSYGLDDGGGDGIVGRRDEDDLFGRGITLLDGLVLLGQLEVQMADEDNYDLDSAADGDRTDVDSAARARLVYAPSGAAWFLVAEGRYTRRWRNDEADGRFRSDNLQLGETYLMLRDALAPGWDLQVGRQDFDDPREWIYDQNLDALRTFGYFGASRLELSVSTTLTDGNQKDEAATNLAAYYSREMAGGDVHLAAWSMYRNFNFDDQNDLDEDRLHLGLRALGEILPDHESWVDASVMRGDREGVDLEGWGYDIGTSWSPDALGPVSLTLGYALGSGGSVNTAEDKRFRQTGLEDNNGRFAGVTSFRYYGELMDPELSNIGIATVGIGARLAKKTSLDLVWHHYRQDQLLDLNFTDSDLDDRPNGLDADLGWELDLILGSRRLENFDFELVAGWFRPGDAFPDADDAFLSKLQIRYRF